MKGRILVISDIHEDYEWLMNRLQDDFIIGCISCGDTTMGFPKDPKDAVVTKPIFTVYGNNENWKYMQSDVHNLTWMDAGKVYDIFGLKVAGMGGVMSKTPQHPSHYTPGEVESSLNITEEVDIFVTHHPPKLYADLCTKDVRKHCGSPDVLKIMDEIRPQILLTGHLHWPQVDIFGTNGVVETFVVTLGQFGQGDYAILTDKKMTLFKKNVKCYDIYWRNAGRG